MPAHKKVVAVDGEFPTLYSLNSDGSIQCWTISVKGSRIIRTYGREGGAVQVTEDVVGSGKNIGRSNETSAEEQALLEATSAWEKKQKSGYNVSRRSAAAGKVSSAHISGGVEPMLAHKWKDHSGKISYPAHMQPKLDGIRCIAIIRDGVCTLWTRTRKPITSVPHITEAVLSVFGARDVVLDGELYNHDMRDNFEEIVSLVRKEDPDRRCREVQYHIYDVVIPDGFGKRSRWLASHAAAAARGGGSIVLVPTQVVGSPEEVIGHFTASRLAGYEGSMIRNDAPYEHKRSYNLQKIKEFDDAEFQIIGVESGRGRMSDCAMLVCSCRGGEFRCKMEGSFDMLKRILQKPKSVIGKMLTVRFQGFTGGNIPRFPVGVSIRDYE